MDMDDLKTAKRTDLDDTSASRTISNAIRNEKLQDTTVKDEAVYGDSDMNPNADDQKDVHGGDS